MATPEKHPCAGEVHASFGVGFYSCSRNGKVNEDGKWWCHQHAPSSVQARRDAQSAKYRAREDTRKAADSRAEALTKRAACGVYNVRDNRTFEPTKRVSIPEADLDRILTEAGR